MDSSLGVGRLTSSADDHRFERNFGTLASTRVARVTIDFRSLAAAALPHAEHLVPRWLPDGDKRGNEWVAMNPKRTDGRGRGSFSINLHTGVWKDFALEKGGPDLVALYAYLFDSANMAVAARAVAVEIGYQLDDDRGGAPPHHAAPPGAVIAPPPRAAARPEDGTQLVPVPVDAPPYALLLDHRQFGRATNHWVYRDAAGAVLMVVIRWADPAKPGEKIIRPWTCWETPSGRHEWKPKTLPTPRPLYRLDEIMRRHEAVVVVCEGEKAADAAQQLLGEGYVTTTSPAGATNAKYADWSVLTGRKLLIWPDHDEPGIRYASDVRRLALDAGATSVQVLSFEWVEQVLAMTKRGAA